MLFGGGGDDLLFGSDNSDVLTGGQGSDTFIFSSGDTGTDTIKDFQAEAGGDVLDFSALISGYDATTDPVASIIRLTELDGNTIVSVDANGAVGGEDFTDVAILEGVTGLNADTMVEDFSIVLA
ncbi:MAG TPA: type I secretion C-terminal target domain-containing protein [Rhodospirillaceae bacterium]|nr:type I secretion C-terminal target domain-containing protein [Rhodospirillaceae bacterium]